MQEQEKACMRRLEEDRRHLLYRLDRIGFVPDKDMRESLAAIRADLQMRINAVRDELMRERL